MSRLVNNLQAFSATLATSIAISSLLANNPLVADDTEIYTGALSGGFEEQIRPNILYIIDTSGSMKASAGFFIDPEAYWGSPYDPDTDYSVYGDCNPDLVYRLSADQLEPDGSHVLGDHGFPIDSDGELRMPACGNFYFPLVDVVCQKALQAYDSDGWYFDYWGEKSTDTSWSSLNSDRKDLHIPRECWGDWGIHGETDGSPDVYPYRTVDSWGDDPNDSKAYKLNQRTPYITATGNFLNWFNVTRSRLAAVKLVLKEVVTDLPDDTTIGLMHFDSGINDITDGGMMIKEFVRVGDGTNRQDFIDTVFSIPAQVTGPTPLAETLLEALYVFAGKPVYFGTATENDLGEWFYSVPASRKSPDPSSADYHYYKSPIEYTCQPSHIIYLSDGAATGDDSAWGGRWGIDTNHPIPGYKGGFKYLPNYESYAPSECAHGCLEFIAEYLANEDINADVAGNQHVYTSTIGFGDELGDSDQDMLKRTAENGKGTFVMANSFDELKDAFKVTTRRAVSADTAFTAPTLAVNAFNRTRDENRVYFALFRTSLDPGWGGNLKAYQFGKRPGQTEVEILDAKDEPAIEQTSGLFAHDARSFWSAANDGDSALAGGAASRLPSTRNIYTWFGDANNRTLAQSEYAFADWNAGSSHFTDEMFDLDGSESYDRATLIEWLSGIDPNTGEVRKHIGDPLHSRPVIVTYGSDPADPQQRIFLTTNDGFLHIINADTGVEEFAFIAEESLRNAKRLYEGDSSQGKAYGLDGAPVLLTKKVDRHAPGINPGDKVYLYVGMRRGGKSYYAFDVTNPTDPKILWRIQGGDLDGDGSMDDTDEPFYQLGKTFSTPKIGRIRLNGSATDILVFAGGYDLGQDFPTGSTGDTRDVYAEDDHGNAVYIVDAKSGKRLWWAGAHPDAKLEIPEMVNSIPSDISLLDSDNDGWTDRIYVGDTGGRIFRIDIDEFNSGAINATGGMIADLGASTHAAATTPDADTIIQNNRKFFYPPDVVMVKDGSQEYLALAVGSGNRAHPSYPIGTDTPVQDMFFVLKDPHVLGRPPGNDYDYGITIDTLYDTTLNKVMSDDVDERNNAIDDMNDAKGWYIKLPHIGEKVLAEAVTFNYRVMFTTFEPLDIDLSTCQARTGIGRLYILDIRNGKPVISSFYGDPNELTTDDRSMELRRDGIPPAPMIAFPEANDGRPLITVGPELPPVNPGSNMRKSYWYLKDE